MDLDLGEYIYAQLLDEAKHYRWRVVLDSEKRAIEIYFAVHVEVDENQYVQDLNAAVNNAETFYFEEVVCFYDETNLKVVPNNYLEAVPVDPAIGVEKGYIDAFIKHLNILASNAMSGLRIFLRDDSKTEFSLSWDRENMNNTIETMKNTNHYSTEYISFFEEEDESLIKQFKEDKNDGVERI